MADDPSIVGGAAGNVEFSVDVCGAAVGEWDAGFQDGHFGAGEEVRPVWDCFGDVVQDDVVDVFAKGHCFGDCGP